MEQFPKADFSEVGGDHPPVGSAMLHGHAKCRANMIRDLFTLLNPLSLVELPVNTQVDSACPFSSIAWLRLVTDRVATGRVTILILRDPVKLVRREGK
ncbi:MAG: hypothetical protein U0903_21460 [Planctomycetales bacterium]